MINAANSSNLEKNSEYYAQFFMEKNEKKPTDSNLLLTHTLDQHLEDNKSNNIDLKMMKFFKKNIKLRNGTIKKGFWERPNHIYQSLFLKASENIHFIEFTPSLISCCKNYLSNENYKPLLCKVNYTVNIKEDKKYINFCKIDNNINENEEGEENFLINPQSAFIDNEEYKNDKIKLIKNVYKILKKNKNFPKENIDNYILNFLILKRKDDDDASFKCKLYTVFPNINFELIKIRNISLSSKFPLNKLLISKKNSSIHLNGKSINSGYISMTNEKRIISLIDDIKNLDFQSSNTFKQIIFGIWLSFKTLDISKFENLDEIILKNKYLIFNKLISFLFISNKIETIFSPSPDEGIFLLVIFFKGAQSFFEVKVIPNEQDNQFEDPNFKDLKNFGNNWLIMKRNFNIDDNNFNSLSSKMTKEIKIRTVTDYIQKIHNKDDAKNDLKKEGNPCIKLSFKKSGNKDQFITNSEFLNEKNDYNLSDKKNYSNDKLYIESQEKNFHMKSKEDENFDPLMEIFDSPRKNKISEDNMGFDMIKRIKSQNQNSNKLSINSKFSHGESQSEVSLSCQQKENNSDIKNNQNENHIFARSIRNYTNKNFSSKRKINNLCTEPTVYHKRQNSFQSHQTSHEMGINILDDSNHKALFLNSLNSKGSKVVNHNFLTNSNFQVNDINNIDSISEKKAMKDQSCQTNLSGDNIQYQQSGGQIQGLNNIITEQTRSIKLLRNKVNELEQILTKVTMFFKEREKKLKLKSLRKKDEKHSNKKKKTNNNNIATIIFHNDINKKDVERTTKKQRKNEDIKNNYEFIKETKGDFELNDDKEDKLTYSLCNNFEENSKIEYEKKGEGYYEKTENDNSNELKSNNLLVDNKNYLEVSNPHLNENTIEIPQIKFNMNILNNENLNE